MEDEKFLLAEADILHTDSLKKAMKGHVFVFKLAISPVIRKG
jgi:hypothetical protein